MDTVERRTNLGERIRMLRKQRGLSQVRLSQDVAMGRAYLSRVESGTRNVGFDMLCRIADGLQVSVDLLLSDQPLPDQLPRIDDAPSIEQRSKQLGANILALRLAQDMTQQHLSEKTHVERSYLAKVEKAQRNASFDILCKLADGLGVKPSDLAS
nr:helix-turn-helix transcriptional regulator [Gordonibacter sp.]